MSELRREWRFYIDDMIIDLSLVDESLRCSYEQRALQHQAALNLALELEKIGQQLRDQTQ